MFNKIFDLSFVRNTKEAWGFYLGHLIIILILGAILAGIRGVSNTGADFDANFNQGVGIGSFVAVVYILVLSFGVIKTKGLLANFKFILLALAAAVLALLGGGILGLIIPSVLTKKPLMPKV